MIGGLKKPEIKKTAAAAHKCVHMFDASRSVLEYGYPNHYHTNRKK